VQDHLQHNLAPEHNHLAVLPIPSSKNISKTSSQGSWETLTSTPMIRTTLNILADLSY
jgi:hypothetical protein